MANLVARDLDQRIVDGLKRRAAGHRCVSGLRKTRIDTPEALTSVLECRILWFISSH
ncbi:MAG: hypothetical protein PVJ47_10220 [Thiohalocapsa sp.]